jgi:hypothetical protein
LDAFLLSVEGGEDDLLTDTLAKTFEPEKGGASSVEYGKAFDVTKEVELAVAEGDQVLLIRRALLRREGLLPV